MSLLLYNEWMQKPSTQLNLNMFTKLMVISSFVALVYCRDTKLSLALALGDVLVIGGTDATKGEFPHQVSLQWGYPPVKPFSHMCGGSIINKYWVLTAAHCVYDLPEYGQFIVRAGKNHVKARETTEQAAYAAGIFIHSGYQGGVSPNDIALIKLTTPFKLNKYVKSIDLPVPHAVPQGEAVLSGWGSTSRTTQVVLPDYLQKVTLPLLDLKVCRRAFRMINEPYPVHDTNLCTGPLTGRFSACNGDSGGPLITKNRNGTTEVIGIVSWGHIPCGAVGAPAVFVRVSAYISWINKVINMYGM